MEGATPAREHFCISGTPWFRPMRLVGFVICSQTRSIRRIQWYEHNSALDESRRSPGSSSGDDKTGRGKRRNRHILGQFSTIFQFRIHKHIPNNPPSPLPSFFLSFLSLFSLFFSFFFWKSPTTNTEISPLLVLQ